MSVAADLLSIDIRAEGAGQRDIGVPAGLWLRERAERRHAERTSNARYGAWRDAKKEITELKAENVRVMEDWDAMRRHANENAWEIEKLRDELARSVAQSFAHRADAELFLLSVDRMREEKDKTAAAYKALREDYRQFAEYVRDGTTTFAAGVSSTAALVLAQLNEETS